MTARRDTQASQWGDLAGQVPDHGEDQPSRRSPLFWGVYVIAAVKFGLSIAFSDRYGWHRDELYYLQSAHHLALGYVDYPPITPLIARIDITVFGTGLVTLRLASILAGSALIVIAALVARELGAGSKGQAVAATSTLLSGLFLGANWIFEAVTFDQVAWAVVILLFARLLRTGNRRIWVVLGIAFGIGLETKYLILVLGVSIIVGLLATSERRQFLTPWPWLAIAIAALCLVPNLTWQIQHGWPSMSYLFSHHGRIAGETSRAGYLLQQLFLLNFMLLPLAVAGIVCLFRSSRYRALAWIPIVSELAFLAAGGKSYYPGPAYILLYAAGGVAVEALPAAKRKWMRAARVYVAPAAVALVLLPITLPVLPEPTMARLNLYNTRSDYADMTGWPAFVRTVGRAYDHIPPGIRSRTGILVGNYGEAGAIDLLGARYHLPQALSGHLTFWYWKPPHPLFRALLLVEVSPSSLEGQCASVKRVARVRNQLHIDNQEYGEPILLCRGHINLDSVWAKQRHYD